MFSYRTRYLELLILNDTIGKKHSTNFGLFYGTFYVEVGNFSGLKLEGKNTTAWYFRWRKREIILFGKWASFDARIMGSKSTQKSTWLISPFYLHASWFHLRKIQHKSRRDRRTYLSIYFSSSIIFFGYVRFANVLKRFES